MEELLEEARALEANRKFKEGNRPFWRLVIFLSILSIAKCLIVSSEKAFLDLFFMTMYIVLGLLGSIIFALVKFKDWDYEKRYYRVALCTVIVIQLIFLFKGAVTG